MYACSPMWDEDWMDIEDARKILTQLSERLKGKYPKGFNGVGVNYGVHITGGEPFLNFELTLELAGIMRELRIPATFVETNCFWCVDDRTVEERLSQLREEGMRGLLVSANPFVVEQVPWERIERAVNIGRKIFGRNLMVYHGLFHRQLKGLNVKGTLRFEDYLRLVGEGDPSGLEEALSFPSLLPMGRMPYRLGRLYRRYPARSFFGQSCREELTRGWHIHIDNYCNYVPGYCGGISLGDARDLKSILRADLNEKPVVKALAKDIKELYELGVKLGYEERENGYISKCHLCVDIRRYIVKRTDEFEELKPREFYERLE